MTELRGKDRLIVALDVPTHDAALALVDELENVSFFKIGLELLFAGHVSNGSAGSYGRTVSRTADGAVPLQSRHPAPTRHRRSG